jgi:hypothetical protein
MKSENPRRRKAKTKIPVEKPRRQIEAPEIFKFRTAPIILKIYPLR